MALDARAAYRSWASFRGAPAATRAFLAARLAVVPLGALEAELRGLSGQIVSLGCGHGLVERYLAELNPAVRVDGFELDERRVAVAEATQARSPRVRVTRVDVTALEPDHRYRGALAVDVLHHVPREQHTRIAEALRGCLQPGAPCLVKDIATTPRWQYLWNRVHDRVVAGTGAVHCRAPDEMADVFRAAGFQVEGQRRLGRLGPYPHYLLEARAPKEG